ncbi:MAG TPA: hypothetical protein VGL57_02220 [Solirubrobacteraceae bacterium]
MVVTCAAVALLVVVLTLTGPGAADATAVRPVAHVAQRHHSEGGHRKPARGARHKRGSCARAAHCKRSAAGHAPARKTPVGGASSAEEDSSEAEAAAEEEEALEGELVEEGSPDEALAGDSPAESN